MGAVKRKISKNTIIDFIVVFLQITYGMCIVQALTLSRLHIPLYIDLILITGLAFLVRFKRLPFISYKHKWLLFIFFLVYVLDFFQNFSYDFVHSVVRLFFLLNILVFVEYLCAMYYFSGSYKKDLRTVTAPLAYFSIYNAIVITICLFFLLTGIFSINNNILGDNPLIHDNYSKGAVYSFPGYLSLVLHNSNRTLSSLNIPALSGITHEPHVLFYLIGAGYFLLKDKCTNSKQSIITLLLFIVALVASSSTTAIIVFLLCLVVDFVWKVIVNKDYKSLFYLIFLFIPLVLFLYSHFDELFNSVSLMLETQLGGNEDSSKGTSEAMLSYVISPEGVFGRGNMPDGDYDQSLSKLDIGIVTSFFDLVIFVSVLIISLKNVFSKDKHIHYVGMAVLYYTLHNLKMSFQGFNYPYMAYMIVLSLFTFTLSKNRRNAEF